MKTLKFKDGTKVNFTDSSTETGYVGVYSTLGEIDNIRGLFTEANLTGATFDGNPVNAIIPTGITIATGLTGDVTAIFSCREKTDIEKIMQTQATMEDVINFLLMQ